MLPKKWSKNLMATILWAAFFEGATK